MNAYYTVLYSVRGAMTTRTKTFTTATLAAAFAARWRASNSQGRYVAKVYDSHGKELAL